MRQKHWYHCSEQYHGERFVAKRRAPILRTKSEPLTPRICVAPSVPSCFAAVLFCNGGPVYVYKTQTPQRGVTPKGVWDDFLTGERWLIPPVSLVLDRVIPADKVAEAQSLVFEFHRETGESSNVMLRFAQYAIAVEVLGGAGWERRIVSDLMKLWNLTDPRDEIIGQYLKATERKRA